MIDMKKLYDLAIDDNLTTKEMKNNGFCSYDLKKLVNDGILQRIQRGKYVLTDVDGLYEYGKDLISDGNRKKAQNCFRKCYELDPKHPAACFQMFFQSIYDREYENTYKYLLQLFSNSKKYENDYKLYLFLLGNICELSSEDIDYTKILEIDDVLLDKNDMRIDNKYLDIQNEIRYDILECKFSKALSSIHQLKDTHVSNLIMKELLLVICKKNKDIDKNILELIQQKKYTEIINILEKEQEKHRLSTKYDLALEICYNIEKMLSTGNLYEYNKDFNEFDINGIIYSNQYEKAISCLEKGRNKEYLNQNILYRLMVDAIDIKNKIIEEEEYLIDKIAILHKNKTFIILNNLTEEQKQKLENIIKAKNNIHMKQFETETDEVILLKYQEKDNMNEDIDYTLLLQEANEYFKQGRYEESLSLYKRLLRIIENPKSFIYGNMGAIYYKLSNRKAAKMCYFIANMVGREEENDFKYYRGNAKYNPYSKQTYQVHMKESDFYNDIHDYYGMEEIVSLIESENDLENIFSQFDLSMEQKNILKLITARNYYSQKNFKLGDKLYKNVEKSKEKTPFVKNLLEEIKTNKKLYQYRSSMKQLKK